MALVERNGRVREGKGKDGDHLLKKRKGTIYRSE